ncbi:MAG: S8 family serine peptidase [Nonlabens sp.]|uniref:S8 family serine peptidase n=1 Tax=Nonlabens sp. TaxID=1888209 RepID=UPI003EF0D4DF
MRIVICIVFYLAFAKAYAQEFHALIYFTDKPNVAASLATPQNILTQKAIQRKARHGIAIDSRDVPMNQNYVAQVKSQPGITYKTQSKWFNCVHVTGLEADINALSSLSFVASIDFRDPSKMVQQPYRDKFIETTTPPLTYGNASNQISMIGLNTLHDTGNTGTGVTIAVTDSGFPNVDTNVAFNQLRGNNGIAGGYDFVAGDNSIYGDHFHGARVLSIMAAHENGNFEGSAPDAQYYLFRTEDVASETPAEMSYWVAAAERADSLGVDVMNVSLGYLGFDNSSESLSYTDLDGQTAFISRGANVAAEKGMIIVVSVGNSGTSASHPYIAAPADADGAFTIGSVNATRQKSNFSSIGPTFDNRLKPDVMAQGTSTALVDENGILVNGSGTSYSAPVISGAIACLVQAFPNLTPQQIQTAVEESSDNFTTPNNQLGYGIPDFGAAFTTLSTLNVESVDFNFYIKEKQLVVVLPQEHPAVTARLYNLVGQCVWQGTIESNTPVELDSYNSGIYILQLDGIDEVVKIAF